MANAAKPKVKPAQSERPAPDEVDADSNDSFPASDAPGWTSVRRIGQPRAVTPPKTTKTDR